MLKKGLIPTSIIFGLICFDLLFWKQAAGINLSIFSLLLILYSLITSKEALKKKEVFLSLGLVLISGSAVVMHYSALSLFMLCLTTFMCLGLIKQEKLVLAFEGLVGFLVSYVFSPFLWINRLAEENKKNRVFRILFGSIKLFVIPLLLFLLFFIIYREASPKFADLTVFLTDWTNSILAKISLSRLFFMLFGLSLILFSLFRFGSTMNPFVDHSEFLERKKGLHSNRSTLFERNPFSALINEFKIGVLVFAVLNLLLAVVNIIDISWIWFGFEVPEEFNLKQFVHEGTYLLIFSILLSIAIFLYFFRSSLNFFPKNKWLKGLGIVWIGQNMILALSVFLRNYHYIDYHGLAGKRIGVIAFLLFTLVGLISLIVKVNQRKTFFYLIRMNSWFILITLTLMSCVHWDRFILYHNLSHKNPAEIDVDYYLELSPTVAPIIYRNLDRIHVQMDAHLNRSGKNVWLRYLDIDAFKDQLEYNTAQYITQLETLDWPSWNYANHRLLKQTELIPLQ